MALKILGISIIALFVLMVGMFAYFRKDLPNITDVSGNNLGGSISYYDRTGKTLLFQDYSAEKRIPVPSQNISPYMKDATVAIEDKSFYHEGAFNVKGITRAAFHDLFSSGGGLQGGSTITQQLVKLNENWTNQRTITRKIKEVILAVELEREYSKDEILTGYLNAAPYGGIEYGCEAAAEDYFHTTCKNLTLAQASMLAAIPRDPPYYSPYSDPTYNSSITADYFDENALIARQHYILDQMVQQGMISQSQAETAKRVAVLSEVHKLESKYQNIKAPYFVLAAKQELQNKYGAATVNRGGWHVTTTLDLNLENEANHLVQNNLPNVEAYGGDEEALVAEQVQTGQMLALVGGVDFSNPDYGQINYAQINISPGSSVKPYDYTTLINDTKTAGAGSVLYDSEGPLPANGYECTNHALPADGGNCLTDYDFRQPGPVTLRYALGGSRNIPAVKAALTVGETKVIQTANAMMGNSDAYKCFQPGVNVETGTKNQEAPCYASAAIGDGAYLHLDQHANGLSTLARLGKEIPQTYILKIQDSNGKTIDQWTQPKGTQVINQDSAYIVDNMASDPRASYLPGSCTNYTCTPLSYGGYKFQRHNGWDIAVKTGTTNYDFDGLMTAWTTQYAVASWVGYHTRNRAMTAGGMEYMTEPLTRGLMEYALDNSHMSPVNWKQPSDIKTEPAFVVYNHVGIGSEEPSPSTDIYPSWYTPPSARSINATVDKVSGKLATSCTPADAKLFLSNSNAASFSIDKFVTGGSGGSISGQYNTSASDDVHHCDDAKPTATLTVSGGGGNTCDKQSGCTITVTVTQGTHPLGSGKFPLTVKLWAGGNVIKTFSTSDASSPQTFSFNYTPTKGSTTINATVTDSVLYQATSNSVTLSTSGGGNHGDNGGGGFGNPGPGGNNGP